MVATVGSISVDLSTNAAKFESGFKGAATTVERQSSRMAKAIANIEKSTSVVATGVKAFAGGVIAQLGLDTINNAIGRTRDAIGRFDEILTNSRATGLATDTYQSLGLAAKKANIDQDTLNSSLLIFAKNAGLAQEGTGGLFNGLAKLNPELLRNIINAKDQEERLKAVADALKNARDETERAAISSAVFGKSGVVLSRLFEEGAASINKFKQAAANLGVIVSDDDLQRAADLDDRLDDLATVINTKLDIALVKLGPALIVAANGFDYLIDKASKAPGEIGAALDFLSNAVDKIEQAISPDAGKQLREEIAAVEAQIKTTKDLILTLPPMDFETTLAKKRLSDLQFQLFDLQTQLKKDNVLKIDTSEAKAKLADLAQQFRASENASMDALNKLLGKTTDRLPTVTGSKLKTNTGPITSTTLTPTGSTIGVTKFTSQTDKEILQELKDQTQQEDQNANDTTDAIDQGTDSVRDSTKTVKSGLDDIFSGQTQGFSDVAQTVEAGSAQLAQAVQEGLYIDYKSLADAVSTGVVSGFSDELLGRRLTFGGFDPTTAKTNPYNFNQPITTDAERQALVQFTDFVNRLTGSGGQFYGKFAEGGSFTVGGGSSYGDKNLVKFLANAGETVTVSPSGKATTVNLVYNAAAGESERTARQNARAMLEVMQREAARA